MDLKLIETVRREQMVRQGGGAQVRNNLAAAQFGTAATAKRRAKLSARTGRPQALPRRR